MQRFSQRPCHLFCGSSFCWTLIVLLASLASLREAPAQEAAAPVQARADKPLNVVVLFADDWRFDTLGSAGNPIVKPPHLDALAREGVRFTNARVTTSICGVSRATLFTGQWMSRHGNEGFGPFSTPWSETYPGLLRANGYHVGHVGKWHNGKFPAEEFDFGRSYGGRHWLGKPGSEQVHVTKQNELDALEFLEKRPKEKPFCLTLAFFATHAEDGHPEQFRPQPESMQLYEDATIPVPELMSDEALANLPPFLQDKANEGRVRYGWRFDTPEKYQTMMKNYYRMATEVDTVCGRVIDELRKQDLLDSTLVIFTTDNGYFHGERRLADKWYPYEESIRVPLIIRDPRVPMNEPRTSDEFALNVDLAPTILAAAGIKKPMKMQGEDLEPLYSTRRTAVKQWRQKFFYEHGTISNKNRIPSSVAVVDRQYKFTLWPEWDYEELYDLKADPLEQVNLVKSEKHQSLVAKYREQLETMRAAAK